MLQKGRSATYVSYLNLGQETGAEAPMGRPPAGGGRMVKVTGPFSLIIAPPQRLVLQYLSTSFAFSIILHLLHPPAS